MRQVFLDTETTGLQPESRRPHHRDRLRRDGQPPPHRPQPPLLRQPRAAQQRRRAQGARPHRRVPRRQAAVRARRRRADRVRERRRDRHPQRRLRRRLPRRRAAPHRPAGVRRSTCARVTDSLSMARDSFPGKSNSLDALCKRFEVDNSSRELHGALLDAGPAGRGLHPHDARPGLAGHRRRRRAAPADAGGAADRLQRARR